MANIFHFCYAENISVNCKCKVSTGTFKFYHDNEFLIFNVNREKENSVKLSGK
jgi:hypothetical protein